MNKRLYVLSHACVTHVIMKTSARNAIIILINNLIGNVSVNAILLI